MWYHTSMIKLAFSFTLFTIFWSVTALSKTVAILPQWHLSAGVNTSDIKVGRELPQYRNQTAIFLIMKEWIEGKKIDALLAEGCEGEINEDFPISFNSWNYKKLSKIRREENYNDVLTHLPLKLEALYREGIATHCADKTSLIKDHQLVQSDLRAYAGFYTRFMETKGKDSKRFNTFRKALEAEQGKPISNPVEFTRDKISKLLKKEKGFLEKRNIAFVEKIQTLKENKLAVIIGARHVGDLKSRLERLGHKVIVPEILNESLPKVDPVSELEKLLNK